MVRKKGFSSLLNAMGIPYKSTPQVRGRIARALAKESKGGKGKISERSGYRKALKKGYKQRYSGESARISRGKAVFGLARATKGGTGDIKKRPAHRKHLGG